MGRLAIFVERYDRNDFVLCFSHRLPSFYVWNTMATLGICLTMIVWGILYETRLNDNMATSDMFSEDYRPMPESCLGSSFW